MINVGELFPNFQANSTSGPIQFYDWMENSWCLFLSLHSNFTSVCTTELSGLIKTQQEFKKRNVKVITSACNSVDSHNQWIADIKSYANLQQTYNLPYPIIADDQRHLAIELGTIESNIMDSYGVCLSSRATFIIDPNKKLRFLSYYPVEIGRNFEEILRVIDALQLTDRCKIATPLNWKPGQTVMLQSNISEDKLLVKYPYLEITSLPSGKRYMKQIPQPIN
ncbi:hypothetical protein RN001_008683 [Aquatica leii]|uniref:thioredoxin-dependent peroxiredoxin n=1 Tax=Aquatica leii TaxID=1421715 RepID=A0AAN7PZD2_9COLE|nr:hypothetical protein RN001_008683 [Aquatica leii]